jgi:type II secretory pathway pseudopilin PulG
VWKIAISGRFSCCPENRPGGGPEGGFSYLSVMALVVLIGISLTGVSYEWKMMAKREKEKELLFRGDAIRAAIAEFVNSDPLRRFPQSMEDLVKDPKSANGRRYLRKLYKDPVTGDDFQLIKDPVRGLIGVSSKSRERPVKIANFSPIDHCFEGKESYREWEFEISQIALPAPAGAVQPATVPGSAPTPCTAPANTSTEEKTTPK